MTVDENNSIVLKRLPTSLEWHVLIKDIPFENVDIDDNGKYDPQKSPHFAKWIHEKQLVHEQTLIFLDWKVF